MFTDAAPPSDGACLRTRELIRHAACAIRQPCRRHGRWGRFARLVAACAYGNQRASPPAACHASSSVTDAPAATMPRRAQAHASTHYKMHRQRQVIAQSKKSAAAEAAPRRGPRGAPRAAAVAASEDRDEQTITAERALRSKEKRRENV